MVEVPHPRFLGKREADGIEVVEVVLSAGAVGVG